MVNIIYNPFIISSFIKIIYADINKNIRDVISSEERILSTCEGGYPVIMKEHVVNLFYLFNSNETWNLVHPNPAWYNCSHASQLAHLVGNMELSVEESYFGIRHNGKLTVLCRAINMEINDEFPIKMSEEVHLVKEYNGNSQSEIWFPSGNEDLIMVTQQGLIRVNSTSIMDLLTVLFFINPLELSMEKIVPQNCHLFQTTVNNFIHKLGGIILDNPLPEYVNILSKIKKNDSDYYGAKFVQLEEIINAIYDNFPMESSRNKITFTINFSQKVIHELTVELFVVYSRLRNYPHERIQFYHHFSYHPYVELLKLLHGIHLHTKVFINYDAIKSILQDNSNPMLHNGICYLIKQVIMRRHEIFSFVYNLFRESECAGIEPKFKTKNIYYPMKVFSPHLLLMSHIME